MKKLFKLLTLIFVFSLVLTGCKDNKETNVTATIDKETIEVGRTNVKFKLNVVDPKAKDNTLSAKVTVYAYEVILGANDKEDLSLTTSKNITKTVTDVELTGLEQKTTYRLVVKKLSGEQTVLFTSEDFTTTDLGSKDNPILVSTCKEFLAIENDLSSHYKLKNDIDFTDYKDSENKELYDTIGTSTKPFTGSLDGNGCAIKNIKNFKYSSSYYYYGIFASIDYQGVVKNLTIENVTFSTRGTDEKLATKSIEYLGVLCGYNEGTIENVTLKNVTIEAGISRSNIYVGLVAGVNDGTIEKTTVQGNLTIESNTSNIYAGSVAGMLGKDVEGNGNKLVKVSANAVMDIKTVRNSLFLGGLVGESRGNIFDSIVTGSLKGRTETTATSDFKNSLYAGGLVGKQVKGYVENAITSLNIELSSTNAKEIKVGGLVGQTGIGNISYCLSNGSIKLLFDTKEQLDYVVNGVSPYNVDFLFGSKDGVNIVENSYAVETATITKTTITDNQQQGVQPTENKVLVSELTKDFYVNSLHLNEQIWNLENLTNNMPVLK